MNEDAIAVFIPIVLFIVIGAVLIVSFGLDYRRRKDIVEASHKERLAAIERGMDIPPLPESFYLSLKPQRRSSYLLPGLVWLFIGIGLFVALGAVAEGGWRYFALVPIGIGLALLIYYFAEGKKLQAELLRKLPPGV
jgi:hypothetical protein